MTRLPGLAQFIRVSLEDMLDGAADQLAAEADLHDPDYWARVAAEDRALGLHAHADDVAFHDTSAGMWEDGE